MSRSVSGKRNLSERKELRISNILDFVQKHENYYEKMNQFRCPKAIMLQKYLTDDAIRDDVHYIAKTFIVFDDDADMIVAYFSIRTACVIRNYIESTENEKIVENIIPCIEIRKLCVNEAYLLFLENNGYNDVGVGQYVFQTFIIPLMVVLSRIVGFTEVILLAIRDEKGKVVNAYREHMGFETLEDDKDKIISIFTDAMVIVDMYSDGCEFMYQDIDEIIRKYEGRDKYE